MISAAKFRGGAQKLVPLHPAERLLLAISTLHLCFLPWALGDMHVWSQVISLIFAALGFMVSLWPRRYPTELSGGAASFRLVMGPKLVRFPIFWIGALLLGYITVQALNPAWRYVEANQTWWLVRVPDVGWLPHGMVTPFGKANPWRSLMVDASAWLVACSLWVGFTRRRTLRVFFVALAVNAFALALLGIAERGLRADKIFWQWQPPAAYFVASFIYKNHAGAYFDLLLSLCVALTAVYHERSRRRLDKSSPSGLFAFFAMVLALIVIFSYSRAATLLMGAYLAFALAVVVKHRMAAATGPANFRVSALLGALLALSAASALYFLPTGEAVERMDQFVQVYSSATPSGRRLATEATLDLFRASPAYGWGAGSFRFAFPIYQRNYPKIYQQGTEHYYWEHAHDDYAELLAELGVVGASLLLAGAACYAALLVRRRFWKNYLGTLLAGGCLVTACHSLGEFNFYNPAILITWCAFWPALVRWVELEGEARPKE